MLEGFTQPHNKFRQLLNDVSNRRKDVQDVIDPIEAENIKKFGECLTGLTIGEQTRHQQLATALKDLEMPIHRIQHQVQSLQDQVQNAEHSKILDWLSTIPHRQHHHSDVLAGTGAWFLTHPRLLEWQSLSSSSFIWLHGIVGCGKSYLT